MLSESLIGLFSFNFGSISKFLLSLIILSLFIVLFIDKIVLLLKEELIGILLLVSKLLFNISLSFLSL